MQDQETAMTQDRTKQAADETVVHTRSNVILTLAALLLSVVALIVTIEGLSGKVNAPTAQTIIFNFATAIFGIVGAIGYWRGRRWGVYAFALSTLGHIAAHTMLLLSAVAVGRTSPSAMIGLAVIPVVAIVILVGMIRLGLPRAHRG
jgi:peptidoglycan/LPS O-acetylase OafA/YrhL